MHSAEPDGAVPGQAASYEVARRQGQRAVRIDMAETCVVAQIPRCRHATSRNCDARHAGVGDVTQWPESALFAPQRQAGCCIIRLYKRIVIQGEARGGLREIAWTHGTGMTRNRQHGQRHRKIQTLCQGRV